MLTVRQIESASLQHKPSTRDKKNESPSSRDLLACVYSEKRVFVHFEWTALPYKKLGLRQSAIERMQSEQRYEYQDSSGYFLRKAR